MQKKVFLDRNAKRTVKRQPYMKLVLYAALALILFVVVAPLLMRKSDKESVKKLEASKGMVVKEIPKTALPPEQSSLQEVQSPDGMKKEAESTAASTPEMKTPLVGAEKGKPENLPEKQLGSTTGSSFEEKGQEPGQKKPVQTGGGIPAQTAGAGKGIEQSSPSREYEVASQPKSIVPPKGPEVPQSSSLSEKQKETKGLTTEADRLKATSVVRGSKATETKAPSPTLPPVKKPASLENQLYIVHLGSFKAKENAEEIKHVLEKKGYTVMLKPYTHSKLGQLYMVYLAPVTGISKANTLMMQIQHESNVKPYIVKVPAEQ